MGQVVVPHARPEQEAHKKLRDGLILLKEQQEREVKELKKAQDLLAATKGCLLYTSPSPRDS